MTVATGPDRRRAARARGPRPLDRIAVRLPGGEPVDVIDHSPLGLLGHARRRLLPGQRCLVECATRSGVEQVAARVVRSAVGRIEARGVVYLAALAFERAVDWPG